MTPPDRTGADKDNPAELDPAEPRPAEPSPAGDAARPEGAPRPSDSAARFSRPRGRLPGVWWISPVGAVGLIVPWTLALTAELSDVDFRLGWRTPKLVTNSTLWLYGAATLVLLLGAVIPQLGRSSAPREGSPWADVETVQRPLLLRAARILFWLTVVGYVAYALAGVAGGVTPSMLLKALTGQNTYGGDLKDRFNSVKGVTTLTQAGIAFVVVAAVAYRRHSADSRQLGRQIAVVLTLGLVRAYLLAERLAILELVVPLIIVVAMRASFRARPRTRTALVLLPLVFLPAMVAVFGAFEYSRSWTFYRQNGGSSFPVFAAERFAGYYATSYNNGQISMDYDRYPGRLPFGTLQALWTAPVIGGRYKELSGQDPMGVTRVDPVLAAVANPEFNNPGGLAEPFVDYGKVGGFVFFFVAGGVVGLAYRAFSEGRLSGVLIYPVIATGLFELPRYIYWTQGRVAPAFAALAIVAYLARRGGRAAARLDAEVARLAYGEDGAVGPGQGRKVAAGVG